MDLRNNEIPENWNDLVVDIQVREEKVFVASGIGNIVEIDSEYFVDEPREAIALADLIAAAPKLLAFVKAKEAGGDQRAQDLLRECFDAKE